MVIVIAISRFCEPHCSIYYPQVDYPTNAMSALAWHACLVAIEDERARLSRQLPYRNAVVRYLDGRGLDKIDADTVTYVEPV